MKKKGLLIGLGLLIIYFIIVFPFASIGNHKLAPERILRVSTEQQAGGRIWWHIAGFLDNLLPQSVYASTTPDYITDADADHVQINAAINACNALSTGGVVQLSGGQFWGGSIIMKSKVSLVGAGAGLNGMRITQYSLANNTNDDIVKCSGIIERSDIRDIYFYGNKTNQTSGNGIDAAGFQYCLLDRVVFGYCKENGLFLDGSVQDSPNWVISFSYFTNNDGDGVHWVNEDAASWMTFCVADANGGSGFYREGNTEFELHHCNAGGNGEYGFYTKDDKVIHDYALHSEVATKSGFYYENISYAQIIGIYSQVDATNGNSPAIDFEGGSYIDVGNIFINNESLGAGDYALKVNLPTCFTMTGGEVYANGAGVTALYYEATNAVIEAVALVAPSGSKVTFAGGVNRHVINCPGWTNYNTGSSSVADGGTFAHELSATPTGVSLVATIAGEIVTATTWNATDVTLAIKKHDGSAGTSQDIKWSAWCE